MSSCSGVSLIGTMPGVWRSACSSLCESQSFSLRHRVVGTADAAEQVTRRANPVADLLAGLDRRIGGRRTVLSGMRFSPTLAFTRVDQRQIALHLPIAALGIACQIVDRAVQRLLFVRSELDNGRALRGKAERRSPDTCSRRRSGHPRERRSNRPAKSRRRKEISSVSHSGSGSSGQTGRRTLSNNSGVVRPGHSAPVSTRMTSRAIGSNAARKCCIDLTATVV